jgi:hypothetical protein
MTESGNIVSKTSVEHVTRRDDNLQADKKAAIEEFNRKIEESLDNANFITDGNGKYDTWYLEDIEYEDLNPGVIRTVETNTPSAEDYGDMLVKDRPEEDDEEAVDKYLNVKLVMSAGTNDERFGRVLKRVRGLDGEPIGRAHANPLFDTREYEIEFTDGTREKYQANIIAENMFAQVDSEGNQHLLLKEIKDHKSNHSAIPISEGTVCSVNGMTKPKHTTRGWFLLVQWRDGSVSLERLADLKESNPVEVAEYSVVN